MLTAVLLLAIGSADLSRSLFRGRRLGRVPVVALTIAASWLLLGVLATTGLGVSAGWILLCLLAAGIWLALTTSDEHATGLAGRAAVGGLIVLLVILLLTDRTALSLAGYLVDGHRDAATAAVRATPLPRLALFLGVALFLAESANIVVRIALHTRSAATTRSPAWRDDDGFGEAALGDDDLDLASAGPLRAPAEPAGLPNAGPTTDPTTGPIGTGPTGTDPIGTDLTRTDLKGGRLIGPLERLLIVAIVLAGLAPIAAALVAAKGIVRFPEIAQDARGGDGLSGTKAEYFLVGSLVSWATAAGAIALLVATT